MLNEHVYLRHTLAELKILNEEAEIYYHGVLAQLLSAARHETEVLLREEAQAKGWPESAEQPHLRIR